MTTEARKDKRQIAIRLTDEQWKAAKHYATDHETSIQKILVGLLENLLKNSA